MTATLIKTVVLLLSGAVGFAITHRAASSGLNQFQAVTVWILGFVVVSALVAIVWRGRR